MAKFLDYDGLTYLWGKMKLSFQEKLISGTSIKTINSESLLGNGDIDVLSDASDAPESDIVTKFDFDAQLNSTDMTAQEVYEFVQSLDVIPKDPLYFEIENTAESASIVFTKAYADIDNLETITVDPTKQVQGWDDPEIEYSIDGENWTTYTFESAIHIGNNGIANKVYFRSDLFSMPTYFIEDNITYVMFAKVVLYGDNVKVGGNVNSLNMLPGEMPWYAYLHLFSGCTTLVSMPSLPDFVVSEWGYAYMFYGCTGLTDGLELHATTIGEGGYMCMFKDCANLNTCTTALPAKILYKNSYNSLFANCSSLATPPSISASIIGESSCAFMFYGCENLFYTPILTARTLAVSCYESMFDGCISIINSTALPATTLAKACYKNMFANCESLENAPSLPAMTLTESCYEGMFENCYSLRTAPLLQAQVMAKTCYKEMFKSSGLTTAPVLASTDLAEGCYAYMFEACTFEMPPELPAMQLARECYKGMFKSCLLERVPLLPATALARDCYTEMFNLSISGSSSATTLCPFIIRIPVVGDIISLESSTIGVSMFTDYTITVYVNSGTTVYTSKKRVDV